MEGSSQLPTVASSTAEGSVAGSCDERFAEVREAFAAHFSASPGEEPSDLGGALAVAIDGKLVVDLWGGHADPARTRRWQRDTLVNIFSTTKGLVALCANRLAESGALDLEAPVASVWPEFGAAGKAQVPIHLLLSHRVGLAAIRQKIPYEKRFDWDAITQSLAAEAPWWEPGTRHGYHAVTFGYLVGEVIRRVDGRSIGRYLREEIAEPAGLDLHIGFGAELDARCAELEHEEHRDLADAAAASAPSGEAKVKPRFDIAAKTRDERSSLAGLAFANPSFPRSEYNSREFRAAEIPAYNGHGTAASLATLYSALASGRNIAGVHLLGQDALRRATSEEAFGKDEVLAPLKTRFGLGFMLGFKGMPLGRGESGFGHPGFGGSLAFGDPERGLGFGYVTNRVGNAVQGSMRAFTLMHRLYQALERS